MECAVANKSLLTCLGLSYQTHGEDRNQKI